MESIFIYITGNLMLLYEGAESQNREKAGMMIRRKEEVRGALCLKDNT